MNEIGNSFDYRFIDPKLLRADKSYQREIDTARVNNIVKNFNPNIFNEPKVSKRNDGYYYVFDGDHSIAAHQIVYGKDAPIKCKVFYGLTPEDEMKLFVQQNGISKTPTKLEKLRALHNHNDPEVEEMVECANIAGVKIDFTSWPGEYKIAAVETAFSLFRSVGRTNFINILSAIRSIWLGSPESFSRGILNGFGYLYKHCADQFQQNDMIASMKGYPVSKLDERARVLSGNQSKRYAIAIAEVYNKRKKTRRISIA